MKKRKKHIDKDLLLYGIFITVVIIAVVACVIIKIWVVCEYGDMPITDVPSWAVPWLIGE